MSLFIVGIDLSGPTNTADTAVAVYRVEAGRASLHHFATGANDLMVLEGLSGVPPNERCVVGIDAPLSYNQNGGDRPADTLLRRELMAAGLRAGSVMAPTMTRMAYLTLRGVVIARLAESLDTNRTTPFEIAEVHPGGAMVLRGAPAGDVREMKRDPEARQRLARWIAARGVELPTDSSVSLSDHDVAAMAAALAAWGVAEGKPVWHVPAEPPLHPYDYAC